MSAKKLSNQHFEKMFQSAKNEVLDMRWDQRETLRPAPFKGELGRMARDGLNIGDPLFDVLPLTCVFSHKGKTNETKLPIAPYPDWVDWTRVQRGQRAFMENISGVSLVAVAALVHGFTVARFGEVLYFNGYAQDAETALERYRETGLALMDWMAYPLDDPHSPGCVAIRNVRAMHSFARRRSKKLFDPEKGEGIALSQFDMAIVQLGFAGVFIDMLEKLVLKAELPIETKEDMVHAHRLIGRLLGIQDEFNVCNNGYAKMHEMAQDYLRLLPHHFVTCRPSAFALQESALDGMQYTGLGAEIVVGTLHTFGDYLGEPNVNEVDYVPRKPLPGMTHVARACLWMMGSRPATAMGAVMVPRSHKMFRNPDTVKQLTPWLFSIGRASDLVLWRILGWISLGVRIVYRIRLLVLTSLLAWITARTTLFQPFQYILSPKLLLSALWVRGGIARPKLTHG